MTGKRKDAGCPMTTVGHDRERLSFCHFRSPPCHSRKFSAGIQGLFLSAPWRRLCRRVGLLRLPLSPLTPTLSRKGRGSQAANGVGGAWLSPTLFRKERAVGPRLTRPLHGSGPASCPPPRHAGLLCQSTQQPTLFGIYAHSERSACPEVPLSLEGPRRKESQPPNPCIDHITFT